MRWDESLSPSLSLWLILNQAEIIPTDRLSKHLQHMEITTFVVYTVQVCVVIARAGTARFFFAIVGFCRTFLVGGKDEEEWTRLYNPKGHAILPLLILEKGALSCQAAYWPLRLSLSSLMETEHERCFAIRRQVWKRVKRNKGKGNETKKKTSEKGAVCARVFPSLISFFKPVTHVLLKGRSPDAGPGGRQLDVNERVFYMRSSPYVKGAGGLLLQNEWVSPGHLFFFKVRTYFKTILF